MWTRMVQWRTPARSNQPGRTAGSLTGDLLSLWPTGPHCKELRQGGETVIGTDGRCYRCSPSQAGAAGKLTRASDERLCLTLQVSRVRCRALADSGACRSLLRYDTWKDICEWAGKSPLLHRIPNGLRLWSLNKNEIPTLGIGRVCIFGQVVEFFVINNMQHDMLLGDDALRTLKAKICYNRDEVRLMGKRLCLQTQWWQWHGCGISALGRG